MPFAKKVLRTNLSTDLYVGLYTERLEKIKRSNLFYNEIFFAANCFWTSG